MKSLSILMMGSKELPRAVNGYLYNWYAASDANFAPTDWKVPTQTEYETLQSEIGGVDFGYVLKESGLTHWNTPNTLADNSSGFTAFGSGNRDESGTFGLLKSYAFLWTTTATNATYANNFTLIYNQVSFGVNTLHKRNGCSIRLLYTGAGTPATVTDYDGNVYDTVVIGTQRFTVQNWKSTKLANGNDIPNVTNGTTWSGLTTLARCAYDNDIANV